MLKLIFAVPLPSHRQAMDRTDEVIVPQGFTAMAEWWRKVGARPARPGYAERQATGGNRKTA